MQFTAQQIGDLLNGTVDGDPNVTVDQLAKIEEATEGCLSFMANKKYEQYIYQTQASIVIVGVDFTPSASYTSTLVRVQDAYSAFSILLDLHNTLKRDKSGIEEPSFIHPSAILGKDVYIGAFVYIGANVVIGDNSKIYPQVYVGDNVEIGNNSTFFPGVKIYYDCKIGSNVTVHSSTVIGSDGFGFAPQANGTYNKVAQIGNVIIENDVEIGSNSSVDRATLGSTIIRKGVKLDNLVQVAHNVEIGANTVIASQSGIAGSAKLGENCVIGGQVAIVGHITIAKGSQVQGRSGIGRSIGEEGQKWAGVPAIPYNQHMRAQVVHNRLPDLERRIEELERKLQQKNPD